VRLFASLNGCYLHKATCSAILSSHCIVFVRVEIELLQNKIINAFVFTHCGVK